MRKYLEWSSLKDVLSDLDINCVLDVGANRGQFAETLRAIGYSGHILSFEPIGDDCAFMAARFADDARWRGFNVALGAEDAEKSFNVAVESSAMSSFLSPRDSSWKLRTEVVQMKRLDGLFASILAELPESPRILLKMDTQGYDIEVVKGAVDSLGHVLAIQSEIAVVPIYESMPSYLEALRIYQELGFALAGLMEAARDTRYGNLVELNCLLIRWKESAHAAEPPQIAATP